MDSLSAQDEPPKTLSDEAYRRLRQDLITGKLAPGGRLSIDRLKVDYAIGASPLREALSRLASAGMVIVEGNRGFRASALSVEDLEDVTRMRILLETQALRESIERGGDDWEARIVAAHHKLAKVESAGSEWFDEWERRNRVFHDALISASSSPWLLHFRNVLYDQHERYRRISRARTAAARDVAEEHRALMEATMARDADLAARLTAEHIQLTADVVRGLLATPLALVRAAATPKVRERRDDRAGVANG